MAARVLLRWSLAALTLLLPGLAGIGLGVDDAAAATLTVVPVSIRMVPGQMITSLTLSNGGDHPIAYQVRAFAWNQDGGSDHLVSTSAIQFSPPLGTLAVGASQVVRLLLREPARAREAAYRLLIDQIPAPSAPGTVNMVLRLSIPVFAEPPGRALARLDWRVDDSDGRLRLVAANRGAAHAIVRDLQLRGGDGQALRVDIGAFDYVLPGAVREWTVRADGAATAPGSVVKLSARTDQGPIAADLRVVRTGP